MRFNLPESVTPQSRNADIRHQRGKFKHGLPIIPIMPREASSYRTPGLLFLINSYVRKIKTDSLTNIPCHWEEGGCVVGEGCKRTKRGSYNTL